MQQRYASPALAPSCFALDHNGPVARAFLPFAEEDLSTPVYALFERTALHYPHRLALDDGETRLTYEETLAAVRGLAARLSRETSSGALIGILLPTSADFSIAMLACFAAGRLFVPLDLHYPPAWVANVMADAAISAVIGRFDAETEALVPAGISRIDVGSRSSGEIRVDPAPDPDAPAFVLFTSGSTGRPKGIVNSERNLLRRVQQYVNAAHINCDDHFLPLSSECTIAGLRERLTALLTGATLHLVDVQRAGARQILRTISECRVTMMYGVPVLLRSLANLDDGSAARSLRVVRVGGDAVLWSDVALLRDWLSHSCLIELGYSSTEAPIMQWFVPRDFAEEGSRVPIGHPLAGNALAILDDAGVPVAEGDVGELVVRSPYVALGRWLNGACVRDDFPDDPDNAGARILRTGDLVRLNKDGLVELIGRKDRQLKIRGIRIEPAEIEAALRLHPSVEDAAILPRRKSEQVRLIAYVTSRGAPADASVPALKDFLKTRLASHLQPHRIYVLEQIPRLPSAKLDMAALAALDEKRISEEEQGDGSTATDGSDLERMLTAIWCRVLDRASIGRDDDFFDIGGDSLATLGLMFEIEEALGVELPVTMIYAAPTIAHLAQAIAEHADPEFSPLVQVKAGRGGVPLFLCHGIGGNVMELFGLGRQLECDGDVYAIQAKGVDGRSEPNHSVAEMADYYISSIRSAQPHGPYLLGGYSSGGLVAFEMACRLKAAGETTALLVLLDTQTNARQWPTRVWLEILGHRLRHHVAEFAAVPLHAKPSYAWRTWVSLWRRLLWRAGATDRDQPFALDMRVPEALQRVYDASLAAVAHYRPGRYDGPTALFVSDERDPLMAPPERVWRNHAQALETFSTPGDHRSMLAGENATQLARALSLRLAKSLGALQRDGK